jgi:hypothetical protein
MRFASCQRQFKGHRISALLLSSALLFWTLCPVSAKADEGDVTIPLSVGTNVYTYHVATGENQNIAINPGQTSSDNSFKISEFPGIGYFVTNQIRLGLNLQFTELVTPEPGDNLDIFGFLPQVNYKFWGPLTVSVVPSFYPVYDGISQYHFAVQGVLAAGVPIGDGFTATAALEVPVFLKISAATSETVGITPIIGVTYKVP